MTITDGQGRAIALRPVRTGDEPLLYQIYTSTRLEELTPLGWSADQQAAFLTMQFTAQTQHYDTYFPDAARQIILCAGAPAGRLYVDRTPALLHIIDVALLPAYRGAGIGTTLLRDLLAEAKTARVPAQIHVERFNPALRLYARLGFTQVADEGVYLLLEWRAAAPQPAYVKTAS